MNSVQVVGFLDELEKIAGIREAIVTALTGRVPLFHGTSKSVARKAVTKGLLPQGSKGVSSYIPGLKKLEKGLSFTTRSPKEAKRYAAQQVGLERAEALSRMLPSGLKKEIKKALPSAEMAQVAKVRAAKGLASLPGGKRVVRASVPRKVLKGVEGNVPEVAGPLLGQMRKGMQIAQYQGGAKGRAARAAEGIAALPFLSVVTAKGGIPAKYIKGPKFQGVGRKEIIQHLKDVRADPKEFAKDVGRSLFNISHRPSTILRNAPIG